MSERHHVSGPQKSVIIFNYLMTPTMSFHRQMFPFMVVLFYKAAAGGQQIYTHTKPRLSSKNKNSSVFQKHFRCFLALIPFLRFCFYPTFSSNYQTTQKQLFGPHSAMPLAGLSHSSAVCCLEEKIIHIFLAKYASFFLFSKEAKLKISGALSGGSEAAEGAIPEQ